MTTRVISDLAIQKLKAAGFSEVQAGAHNIYQKRMPISEMPYAAEHIVDGHIVGDSDTAVLEFFPHLLSGGAIQMFVENTDYREDAVAADSEEGIALLRDAGINL